MISLCLMNPVCPYGSFAYAHPLQTGFIKHKRTKLIIYQTGLSVAFGLLCLRETTRQIDRHATHLMCLPSICLVVGSLKHTSLLLVSLHRLRQVGISSGCNFLIHVSLIYKGLETWFTAEWNPDLALTVYKLPWKIAAVGLRDRQLHDSI